MTENSFHLKKQEVRRKAYLLIVNVWLHQKNKRLFFSLFLCKVGVGSDGRPGGPSPGRTLQTKLRLKHEIAETMASEAERKMAIAPGLLLVAVLLVAVSDLAEGKAAQMGGCYHQPSHWVHCNAWNSSMCPSDRSWMSLTASLATSAYNKPCTCATMDTGYCYSEITKGKSTSHLLSLHSPMLDVLCI